MATDVTVYDNYDTSDGFGDAAHEDSEKLLRGTMILCTEGHWLAGKERERLPHGTRFVATGTAAAMVRWENDKPAEYRVRGPRERLPSRADLGYLDKKQWKLSPSGEPQDPWQDQRYLYLADPRDASIFTYVTATFTGRSAVNSLASQIVRMRVARPGINPVVEFDAAAHQTKYGRKMKPVLRIVGWVGGNLPGTVDTVPQPGGDYHGGKPALVPPPAYQPQHSDMMSDDVPF
jgi:hypothetical protein